MGVAIVIFIVIILIIGIYDAQLTKQKEREDYFIATWVSIPILMRDRC